MSLYQSYRPKNFSDVVGQDFVKKVLAHACKKQTFHHGYIFFGFHGIGKTTLARIFAEAVNCTNISTDGSPCHACENCRSYDAGKMIDVIEIDAASYTGVDNIREIIEHAKFSPTQGKYKVYIIDEVHMLSKGAFNALLKTLEEPPAHAIFLLATTEIHKIPDTILSRVIRFDLTKINEGDMTKHLEQVCTQENIQWDSEALRVIVHRSRGSLRDSLTMLEKCLIEKNLSLKNVEQALHLVNTTFLKQTFEALESGKGSEIQRIIHTLQNESSDIRQFSAQMSEWIVDHINDVAGTSRFAVYKTFFDMFTRIFMQSKQVAIPLDILKMSFYECVKDRDFVEQIQTINNPTISIQQDVLSAPIHELPPVEKALPTPTHELPEPIQSSTAPIFSKENFLKKAQEIGIKTTIIPLLKTATIESNETGIVIHTTAFTKTRCEDPSTYAILQQAAIYFGLQTLEIISLVNTTEKEVQTDSADMARAIFE